MSIYKMFFLPLLLITSLALAHPPMMGHMGDRDDDDGPPWGWGHGMHRGMMGYGMMGGPMMGGPMMGYGMHMGPIMGGMMGMHPRLWGALELSKEQRQKIRAIHDKTRDTMFGLMKKMRDTADPLYDLYNADKRDAKAIGKVYGDIFDIRQRMIEIHIEAGNAFSAVLNDKQKTKLKEYRSRWMMDSP